MLKITKTVKGIYWQNQIYQKLKYSLCSVLPPRVYPTELHTCTKTCAQRFVKELRFKSGKKEKHSKNNYPCLPLIFV